MRKYNRLNPRYSSMPTARSYRITPRAPTPAFSYCTPTFKRRISMTTRKGRHIYKHTFPLVQHTKDDRHEDERVRLPLRLPQPLTFPNVAVGGFAHTTPNQLRKATQRE